MKPDRAKDPTRRFFAELISKIPGEELNNANADDKTSDATDVARRRHKSVVNGFALEDDAAMPGAPEGFIYRLRKNGDVEVLHHGRSAAVLRGAAAARFLTAVDSGGDPQELMARVTGNYRHGNERTARSHPRNRGR